MQALAPLRPADIHETSRLCALRYRLGRRFLPDELRRHLHPLGGDAVMNEQVARGLGQREEPVDTAHEWRKDARSEREEGVLQRPQQAGARDSEAVDAMGAVSALAQLA